MNYLVLAGQIITYVFLSALVLWGLKHAVSLYIFSRKREEINQLFARISVLKMHLKGKIKRKCNKIEKIFKKEQATETLSMIETKLRTIADLTFSSAYDYQTLINNLSEITQALIDHIKRKNKALINLQKLQKENEIEENIEIDEVEEKCKKLVKYDKGTMTVIVELVRATQEIVIKINEFNALTELDKSKKKITDIPQLIEIEHFEYIANLVELAKTTEIGKPEMQILGKEAIDDAS